MLLRGREGGESPHTYTRRPNRPVPSPQSTKRPPRRAAPVVRSFGRLDGWLGASQSVILCLGSCKKSIESSLSGFSSSLVPPPQLGQAGGQAGWMVLLGLIRMIAVFKFPCVPLILPRWSRTQVNRSEISRCLSEYHHGRTVRVWGTEVTRLTPSRTHE